MFDPLEPTDYELIQLLSPQAKVNIDEIIEKKKLNENLIKDITLSDIYIIQLLIEKWKTDKECSSPFTKEAVNSFREGNRIRNYPIRHYSQTSLKFDTFSICDIFSTLGIPTQNITATIIGGFTGEFADSLRSLGIKIIFTDPIEHWVEQASSKGLEAYKFSLQSMPDKLVKRTQLFATFECYPAFEGQHSGENEVYDRLRVLIPEHGFVFVDSRRSLEDTQHVYRADGKLRSVKSIFRFIIKAHNIKRRTTWTKDKQFRFTHIKANPDQRIAIEIDCKVMRSLYYLALINPPIIDFSKEEFLLEKETADCICRNLGLNYVEFLESVYRILVMTEPIAWERRYDYTFDPQVFRIHDKNLRLCKNVMQDLEKEKRVKFLQNPASRRFL